MALKCFVFFEKLKKIVLQRLGALPANYNGFGWPQPPFVIRLSSISLFKTPPNEKSFFLSKKTLTLSPAPSLQNSGCVITVLIIFNGIYKHKLSNFFNFLFLHYKWWADLLKPVNCWFSSKLILFQNVTITDLKLQVFSSFVISIKSYAQSACGFLKFAI